MTDKYRDSAYWEALTIGDEGPTVTAEDVCRKDFVRFAGATGDFNPMHYDEPAAQDAGHRSVFGPGMLTGGFCAHMLSDWFGIEHIRSFSVRFTDRVWPGDTVTVSGTIDEKYTEHGTGYVDVSFKATTQQGTTVVTGTATAAPPTRD